MRAPKNVTVRWTLGFPVDTAQVTWWEIESVAKLRAKLRAVREGTARAVLRRKDKEANLWQYDIYVRQLRAFCRRHGISEPRLSRALQAQLTQVRRAVAVMAKLKGRGT